MSLLISALSGLSLENADSDDKELNLLQLPEGVLKKVFRQLRVKTLKEILPIISVSTRFRDLMAKCGLDELVLPLEEDVWNSLKKLGVRDFRINRVLNYQKDFPKETLKMFNLSGVQILKVVDKWGFNEEKIKHFWKTYPETFRGLLPALDELHSKLVPCVVERQLLDDAAYADTWILMKKVKTLKIRIPTSTKQELEDPGDLGNPHQMMEKMLTRLPDLKRLIVVYMPPFDLIGRIKSKSIESMEFYVPQDFKFCDCNLPKLKKVTIIKHNSVNKRFEVCEIKYDEKKDNIDDDEGEEFKFVDQCHSSCMDKVRGPYKMLTNEDSSYAGGTRLFELCF